MNNIYRIIAVLIYPLLLLFSFFTIYRKNKYKIAIINNIKPLIINTLFITFLFSLFIFFFLRQEHTIYSWDYSGHWVRSLTLRKVFFENPPQIFKTVFDSMNNSDYSYVPALFSLPFIIINTGYPFFCVSNFICFVVPVFIVLSILYYSLTNKYKYLPSIILVILYPVYYPILYGKPCVCGVFFIACSYMLLFFQSFNEIDTIDVLSINLFTYISIFERRWYLYSILVLYLSFIIKYLIEMKTLNNKIKPIFTKLILSGIIALLAIIIFNNKFLINVLTNGYQESYSVYNHEGKVIGFINYYSIIILCVSIFGYYQLFIKDKTLLIINVFSLLLSTVLFWKTQSFEDHHYYISIINIIIPFTYGLIPLLNKKYISYGLCIILIIQASIIYFNIHIPGLTSKKRYLEKMSNIEEYANINTYLGTLSNVNDDNLSSNYIYIASSSPIFNEDLIRNVQLPDINFPQFEYAQYDLIDGFPPNFSETRYLILTNPIQYSDPSTQHIFSVINDLVQSDEEFIYKYSLIKTFNVYDIKVNIYEKNGEFTQSMKQKMFNEITKYYPNNQEVFKSILE